MGCRNVNLIDSEAHRRDASVDATRLPDAFTRWAGSDELECEIIWFARILHGVGRRSAIRRFSRSKQRGAARELEYVDE